MYEEDAKIFGEAYELYGKWRGIQITKPEQWVQVTNEFHEFVCKHENSQLALRLAIGLMDTFDYLYKDGAVPAVPDYFGRSDL